MCSTNQAVVEDPCSALAFLRRPLLLAAAAAAAVAAGESGLSGLVLALVPRPAERLECLAVRSLVFSSAAGLRLGRLVEVWLANGHGR